MYCIQQEGPINPLKITICGFDMWKLSILFQQLSSTSEGFMAHIHLIVHVMHELVPKSALIVLMGRLQWDQHTWPL